MVIMNNVWQVVVESFPQLLSRGLLMTIPLTLISFAIALLIAVVVALVQFAHIPVLRQICRFYIWVIRGTPLLVQLYVIFFGLPSIGVNIDAFPAAVLVFSINEGAYAAETIRGALEAVPAGQMEAGRCVGLSYVQIMWHILLPQTFRTAFPALGNELISMVKDTSLAANITVTEMFFQAQRIAGRTYQTMALYLEVAFIYLMFSTVLSLLQRFGEKKLSVYGKR
ncbi:MAG: amino acid ABC transporter permease [Lachnospiraceae bacterium]|nr:amino acid ABC transporter permease [Lachnospiraceae bacterium]